MISVIVPVYNVENILEECLNSIVQQTYKKFEVILINDGSCDKSESICQKYCYIDNRFTLVSIENSGQGYARNLGLTMAKGDWVMFVDSDDLLPLNSFELLINNSDYSDIVIGDYSSIWGNKVVYETFLNGVISNELSLVGNALGSSYYGAVGTANVGVPWAKLYNYSFLMNNKIFFPDIRRMQDTIFNINAFMCKPKIKFVKENVYYYRITENSSINKYWPKFELIAETLRNELRNVIKIDSNQYKNLYNYKSLSLLFDTIKAQIIHPDNRLSAKNKINQIELLCSGEDVKSYILEAKISLFTKKQLVMLFLIRNKMYSILYFLLTAKQISLFAKLGN